MGLRIDDDTFRVAVAVVAVQGSESVPVAAAHTPHTDTAHVRGGAEGAGGCCSVQSRCSRRRPCRVVDGERK